MTNLHTVKTTNVQVKLQTEIAAQTIDIEQQKSQVHIVNEIRSQSNTEKSDFFPI